MVAFAKFLLFAGVAVAGIIPRDAPQIIADLKQLNLKANNLANKVQAYNGGVANVTAITNAAGDLDNAIKTATSNVQKSKILIPFNTQKIITYVTQTFEPTVLKAVNKTIAKKAQFTAAGLDKAVLQILQGLKNDAQAHSSALVAKSPAGKKDAVQLATSKIGADLQKGVNAFS